MKNHELLNLIGEASEDYVLEAGNNVVKPRFGWKKLAACAACAALVLGAYPVYRAVNPPLHGYTAAEGGSLDLQGGSNAPQGGVAIGADLSKIQEVIVSERTMEQYDRFLANVPAPNGETEWFPEWCGGVWLNGIPDDQLVVAIVEGFRTPELEAQILDWCGGEVVFKDVKYSWIQLNQMMAPIGEALDGTDMSCAFGVSVMENCLNLDIYGDSIPKKVLAKLASLDPDGDAIQVRLIAGSLAPMGEQKDPAPDDSALAPVKPVSPDSPSKPDGQQPPQANYDILDDVDE